MTDRCNLRCVYCLPEDARGWIPRADLLTLNEYRKLIRIALTLGITQIRLTGGEPLLRPDLEEIVAICQTAFTDAGLPPRIALTTNAIGLDKRVEGLKQAGLERINVSIDTLSPARFTALTRRPVRQLDSVLAGLEAAASARLTPIKINTVILDQTSLEEIPELVEFALKSGYQWRAIEFMAIGPLAKTLAIRPTAQDIRQVLQQHFHLTRQDDDPSSPARTWKARSQSGDTNGIVGIIASTTAPFCVHCDRTRLSADGKIYNCLFSQEYTDLRASLRRGASDLEIQQAWVRAMWGKAAGYRFLPPLTSDSSMSKLGG